MTVATSRHSGLMLGPLWSARALDWATYQEPQLHEIYTAVLAAVPQLAGQRLLDVGCGSGALIRRAAKHGATVTGLDAASGLAAIARKRVPGAEVEVGELEQLPYRPETFDIVTGVNAFPHATDPLAALIEARRVLRSHGYLVAVTWGPAEQCAAAAYLGAVEPLLPPTALATPGPFDLAGAGDLAALVEAAGFSGVRSQLVPSTWDYEDSTALLRGVLADGDLVRAVAASGSYAVTSAVLAAVEPFRLPGGGYRLHNVHRLVVATR